MAHNQYPLLPPFFSVHIHARMPADSKEYQALQRNSSERWSHDENEDLRVPTPRVYSFCSSEISRSTATAVFLLLISLAANVFLALRAYPATQEECGSYYGRYSSWSVDLFLPLSFANHLTYAAAGLRRHVPLQIYPSTEYTGENLTEVTALWQQLSGDPGVVALPRSYVEQKGLPHALRWPWDPEDKGVYLLQGFHNLHCLRTLFRYILAADQGLPQHIALSHALHCLDQLRQDVMCNADDTPRYAGFQDPPGTGAGQVRVCKDWAELEQWALERTACFEHHDEVPGPMIDRFKSCPDGRVLWPTAEVHVDGA